MDLVSKLLFFLHLFDFLLSPYCPGQPLENIKTFSYNELRTATDDFHLRNKIGRGGFGTVYKGIHKDGTQIAVKTLSAESRQGVREFLTEIKTISNVKHPNLVELIGCCAQGANRVLVYEYLENNSLDYTLLGTLKPVIYFLTKTSHRKLETLGWRNFFRITSHTLARK
ncbi:hypothetical protein CsSME_00030511 [Camellia sinensis var. sinensis]